MDIYEAADRLEIQQELTNYATAVDNKDWPLYRTVFTSDADIDYTGSFPLRGNPEKVAATFEHAFAGLPWAQHFITNVSYRFEKDTCDVRAYFYNPCQIESFESVSHHFGYYDHLFVRTEHGWKSSRMVETMLNSVNASPGLPVVLGS